jgi:hypothetical protein
MRFDDGIVSQHDRLRCRSAVVLGVVIAWLFSGGTVVAQTSEDLPESIGILMEHRVKAEHWAAVLKGMRDELSRSEYLQGETYYVEGKAAVDNWLERLLAELEQGGGTELSEGQRRALEQTGVKAHVFMEYVVALDEEDRERGDWAALIPGAITGLVDAGTKLWHEFRSAGRERREALVRRLEGVRWPSFDDIRAK